MSEPKLSPVILMPQITTTDDLASPLPLEQTTVTAQAAGPIVSVVVVQRFGNPLKEPAELDYLFPLPEDAAITEFELTIGARRIHGDLREQKAAQEAYEAARSEGKRAGLLEQRRTNLFALRLANVQPGETIHATVRYQQRLKFDESTGYEFVYPMGLTPKYDSPAHPGEGDGTHAPIADGEERIGSVEISVSVDAGVPVKDPRSPSHTVEVVRLDDRRFQVRLSGENIPDRDFVLRYAVCGEQPQAAGWTSGQPGQAVFLASLLPPRLEGDFDPAPREFVFVLDRSGSMTGEPIRQARNALRACLRALNEKDTFYILLFDNALEWFQPKASPVQQAQIDLADAYLDKVEGRGGTEIVQAVEAALNLPADRERSRFVVFLTDGAVSAEARALDAIRKKVGGARLFTFGIGSSVNRALLSGMARLGRGEASFLQLNEDIEGAIIRFQDSVSFPALTDLTLEWQNGKAWDIYPTRLPDLYYGQPLEICGRLAQTGSQPATMTLKGKRAGQNVQIELALTAPPAQDGAIGRVWARSRIDALMEQAELEPQQADKLRQEIIGVALEHQLVTAYTAFVAIDQQPAASGEAPHEPRVLHVAQPLPHGIYPQVYTPGMPPVQAMGMAYSASMMPSPGQPAPTPRAMLSAVRARFAKQDKTADNSTANEVLRSAPAGRAWSPPVPQSAEPEETFDREATLRWLARTQKLDGAWNSDIERTAAALLAFVRAGHTTRTGSFRQVVRRAARWLVEHPGSGWVAFLRARALDELSAATGDLSDAAEARVAHASLPGPSGALESAAAGPGSTPPASIRSLDDLRLAVLLNGPALPVPPDLLQGKQGELGRIWAAALK